MRAASPSTSVTEGEVMQFGGVNELPGQEAVDGDSWIVDTGHAEVDRRHPIPLPRAQGVSCHDR